MLFERLPTTIGLTHKSISERYSNLHYFEQLEAEMNDKAEVARLNDLLRTTMHPRHGQVVVTHGVAILPMEKQLRILTAIQEYDEWTREVDPHGEHDFCAVTVDGERFFAKCDYYDPSYRCHSENPADPVKTKRVLTVKRAGDC